jgi:hypothetical protein
LAFVRADVEDARGPSQEPEPDISESVHQGSLFVARGGDLRSWKQPFVLAPATDAKNSLVFERKL